MSLAKTIDCDVITLRTINAKTTNNQNIPYNNVLIADGNGGTFWSTMSTAGQSVGFDTIAVDGSVYASAGLGRTLNIASGPGFGTYSVNSNTVGFFSKSFQTVNVVGGNRIEAYANTIYPTLNIATQDGISVVANPDTHTLTFRSAPIPAISTGVYAFGVVETFSNVSTVSSGIFTNPGNRTSISALNVSSPIRFVGLGDIVLTTDYTNSGVYVGISSFTSAGYSTLQGTAYSAFSRTMSSVSSLFTDRIQFNRVTNTLDENTSNLSTALSNVATGIYDTIMLYTTLDQYGQTSTFVDTVFRSSLNFTSSLGSGTVIHSTLAYDPTSKTGNILLFSSATFHLGFLSEKKEQLLNAWAQIQYSPSFVTQQLNSLGSVVAVSTFLTVGNTVLSDTLFTRSWFPNTTMNSNLYTDTFTMHLPYSTFIYGIQSNLTIQHRIESIDVAGTKCLNMTSRTNSLIFHIENNRLN